MCAYVIQSWSVANNGSEDGNFVSIRGRTEGIISWILTQVGISPTVTITVTADQVRITEGSLSGAKTRILPLTNICSTFYGYHKPLREALMIAGILMGFGFLVMTGSFAVGLLLMLVGAAAAVAYYFFNKTLTLAFVENSGVANAIAFKRSVIEGKNIDEASAGQVAELTQSLIDQKQAAAA